jgi:hypothetical protein
MSEELQEFENDTLKVSENADGTLSIEWDPEDPNYAFLNDLTEAQITAMLEKLLTEYSNDESLLESDE